MLRWLGRLFCNHHYPLLKLYKTSHNQVITLRREQQYWECPNCFKNLGKVFAER